MPHTKASGSQGDCEAEIRIAFLKQAEWCEILGSPFTARVCTVASEVLDHSTETGRRILTWAGNSGGSDDALALRFAGGLHGLKRDGTSAALAKVYPPHDPSDEELYQAIRQTLCDCDEALCACLDLPPQTNEVARSAILMAGLMAVSADKGLPIRLYELGASAGLNLVPELYGYQFGVLKTGAPDARLILKPEWNGPPPPDATVSVVARRGVDLNPLDVTNVDDRARMMAYVWADQPERMRRIEAAVETTRSARPELEKGDAAEWLAQQLAQHPDDGVCRVVMHSIAFQYFPAGIQEKITNLMVETGANASSRTPLAWLRFELDDASSSEASLRVTLWPDGTERLLACADPHVRKVRWF